MRLQKYLSQSGVASRRKSEEIILASRVSVNDQVVIRLGTTVTDKDVVKVDGRVVKPATTYVYYVLNKPKGIITSSADEKGRKTVLDFVSKKPRVVACGRLDAESKGLVLLTNDGELCNQLTHPRYGHEKEYAVAATLNKGPGIEERIRHLEQGIELEDGKTSPAKVTSVKRRGMQLGFSITLREGKNRQIRRMCSSVGLDVVDLVRTRIGKLELSTLPEGKWRLVRKEEIT